MKNIFELISKNWWEKTGPCKPLHTLNTIRFNFIKKHTKINKKNILDIGCGAGILSEKLSLHGGMVTGIDISKKLINIAQQHSQKNKLQINYQHSNIENFIKKNDKKFDILICTEVLEHLNNPEILIKLCKKANHEKSDIFLSSLNKNIITYINIILLGEFISKKLKKNTHNYNKFISIHNLKNILNKEKLYIKNIKGLIYNPILNYAKISNNYNINYLIHITNNE